MKNKNAFTMVELLVSIVVASILILSIGVLSQLSLQSHQKLRKEADLFGEIAYGFKLMHNKAHSSVSLVRNLMGGTWTSDQISVDEGTFGLQDNLNNSNLTDFVFLQSGGTRDIILTAPKSPSPINFLLSNYVVNKTIKIELNRTNDKSPFKFETTLLRRIQ